MKRLLSAVVALSLLSGTVAFAEPFDHRGGWHDRDRRDWDGRRHHGRDNGAGTAIAVGVGLLALTAIVAASQDRDREIERRREERYYRYDAPPPPPDYWRNGPPRAYDNDGWRD